MSKTRYESIDFANGYSLINRVYETWEVEKLVLPTGVTLVDFLREFHDRSATTMVSGVRAQMAQDGLHVFATLGGDRLEVVQRDE